MAQYLENNYDSVFYGYCNADLLFHSSILPTLVYIASNINNTKLKQKVRYRVI